MNQPKPYTTEEAKSCSAPYMESPTNTSADAPQPTADAQLSFQLAEAVSLLKEILHELRRREDEHQRTTVADQCRNMTILSIKESTGISNRTIRILEKKKICSIHELLTYKEEEIRNINGLGCQSWFEIKRLIAYLNRYFNGGISLGMFNKNL